MDTNQPNKQQQAKKAEDEPIAFYPNLKTLLIALAVLILIGGFFAGKIYLTNDISKNYKCFLVDEVKDICSQCRYKSDMTLNLSMVITNDTEQETS